MGRGSVEAILKVIPTAQRRDRLLFRLIFETGLRVSERWGHLEDLDLTADDEHLNVVGKGGQRRMVLLDDATLVRQLRTYLKQTGYRHGPLFRAEKNGQVARCGTNRCTNRCRSGGRGIVPRPGCRALSTSCAIPTRPSWSMGA